MFPYRRPNPKRTPSFTMRSSRFIDRDFQLKYTSVVLLAAIIGTSVTVVPSIFFLNENYQIFVDLAYDSAPQILEYLERERAWLNLIIVSGVLGTLAFFWYLGLKMTSRIVGPINVLKNHIRGLTRGKWDQPLVKTRDKDEFNDLIETYNYFYESFQVNLKRDLAFLQKLAIDPQNRDAYLAWKNLIKEKQTQLGIDAKTIAPIHLSERVLLPSESSDRRRVS
jgi:hypothetical protein